MAFLGLYVFFCGGIAAGASFQSRAASQRADAWLLKHKENPDAQGLKDLKGSDPDAYSIVTALLTKSLEPTSDPFALRPRHRGFKEEAEAKGLFGAAHGTASLAEVPYQSYRSTKPAGPMQISLDWGDTHAGTSDRNEAKMAPSQSFHQRKVEDATPVSSSLLMSHTQWKDSSLSADAAALGTEMVVEDENSNNDVASKDHHRPIVVPNMNWGNPHAGLEDSLPQKTGKTQVAMGQQNSYLGWNAKRLNVVPGVHSMSQSKSQMATQDPIYAKYLQTARDKQWKFALESTDWGKSGESDARRVPRTLAAMAQEDLDLDDDEEKTSVKGRSKALSRFLDLPITAMTQNVVIDKPAPKEDNVAKLNHWLAPRKKATPSAESTNPYLMDLKSAIPANLNLLVPVNAVPEPQKLFKGEDDSTKLDRWLKSDKKQASASANPYMMDLKSA